jgi:hypothetical protein
MTSRRRPASGVPRRLLEGRAALPAAFALAAALSLAWRLPFSRLPITTDEAGYTTVARLWSHGAVLYRTIWVDRPQGLLLVFRALLHVDAASPTAIRATAAIAGIVLLALLALVASEMCGRPHAIETVVLAGAFGASPFIESFTLSGELVATIPAVASVYCFVRWLRTRRLLSIATAGLLAGAAVMVKQSAFDAAVVAALYLLVARPARWRAALGVFACGMAVPIAVCAATAPHPRDWWFAVVSYRGAGNSIIGESPSVLWTEFTGSLRPFVEALAPLLVLAGRGLAAAPLPVRLWLLGAALGVVGGGSFHAHYYIQLVPPLALAAASGFDRMVVSRRRVLQLAIVGGAVILVVVAVLPALGASKQRDVRLFFPNDPHLASDAAVARVVAAESRATDSILVLPPTASIYYLAHRNPAIPYLWVRNAQTIPRAKADLKVTIKRAAPSLVVVEGPLRGVSSFGVTPAEVEAHYRLRRHVAHATVLIRR